MKISRQNIERYLDDRGWKRRVSADASLIRYQLTDGEGLNGAVNIFFSTTDDLDVRANEAVAALEVIRQVYSLSEPALRAGLTSLAFDKILATIPDDYIRNESIELRAARSYLNGMKGLIAASAMSELTGERTFRRTNKEASDYADRCRFAHTFKGSFGLAIESPVGFNDQAELAFIEPTIPFGRKVIRRIANGLQSVVKSFNEDSVSPILEAADGLNANMCSELVSIIDRTEIPRIDIAFVLSPEWEPDVPPPPAFHIDARYRELLKDASARLTTEDDAQPVTVVGRIVNLHADLDPDDLLDADVDRIVQANWDSPEHGLIKVSIGLSPAGYLAAVEAHGKGQLISVQGALRRKSRSWILQDAQEPRFIQI